MKYMIIVSDLKKNGVYLYKRMNQYFLDNKLPFVKLNTLAATL